MILYRVLLLVIHAPLTTPLRILSAPLRCPRQDLNCTAQESNCMDKDWIKVNKYTPSSPEELQVSVETVQDGAGRLQPVLNASWKLKDDGSIHFLNATELHVLVISTNQNQCVRYSFTNGLKMRSPSGEKWSFSARMLVLDPGQSYWVSVFNIPKPELGHSSYDISKHVDVEGCDSPRMQRTQFCVERGSLWQPNISVSRVTAADGSSALAVSFSTDRLCDDYTVIVRCSSEHQERRLTKANHASLNVTLSLDLWPRSCCQFDAEIKPHFPQCGQDCPRRRTTQSICSAPPTPAAVPFKFIGLGLGVGVVVCGLVAAVMYALCRSPGGAGAGAGPAGAPKPQPVKQTPKVLVIYSQDHHLYRDVVLKLCAFLQIKCGTKVLVDLLDSTSVSMVGRLRWLEGQRQQLKDPSDKILVLCSRGVQAKWKAMCGQGSVTLREDLLSPTDDMLTPFLNLFLPEMHQAGMLGRYMVAYFDDISSEQDVPSVLDIAVKYSLMKHFEELYFRILDVEKYQPGQVNHIEGIGADEYFNCPSGRALKNAIETFHAYQCEHPDWFEQQCVGSEEDVLNEADQQVEEFVVPSVFECVPLIRDSLPVYVHDIEINGNSSSVHVLTPAPAETHLSVTELIPALSPKGSHASGLEEVLTDHLCLLDPGAESVYIAEPVLNKPPIQRWAEEESLGPIPTEDNEEPLMPISQASAHLDQSGSALHDSLDFSYPELSRTSSRRQHSRRSVVEDPEPVLMEEGEDLELKGQSSGSDQGYISKVSSQHELFFEEDSLVVLARLQEKLFQENLAGSEGNSAY